MSKRELQISSTELLRQELLTETLINARKAPYYQKFIPQSKDYNVTFFKSLATVSKQELTYHGQQMLTSNEFPFRIGISSGTTWQLSDQETPPSLRYESILEREAFNQRAKILGKHQPQLKPLTLNIITAMHGASFSNNNPGVFEVALLKPFHLHTIKHLLKQRHDYQGMTQRIENIFASVAYLKLLSTIFSRDSNAKDYLSNIKNVYSFADYLSPRWKTFIESSFNAKVYDSYGLSEIRGSICFRCEHCHAFHMEPFIIPEILATQNDQDISVGECGELTLTSLYPFSQLQPLIRYRTGDIVKRIENCPVANDITFLPVGRKKLSLFDDKDKLLIPSFLLYEVIDNQVFVHRDYDDFLELFSIGKAYGAPRFHLQAPNIVVEVNFHPSQFPQQKQQVLDKLFQDLKTIMKRFCINQEDQLEHNPFKVVAPNSLQFVSPQK